MFNRVKDVKPLEDMILEVRFLNGVAKLYDVKPLLTKWRSFEDLRRISGLFKQVHVDQGGYGVSWNDDIDLSCNELWEGSTIVLNNYN